MIRQSKSVSTEEESNEEVEDDFEEIENDVLEELPPVKKKGFALEKSQPLHSLKRHSSSGKLKTKDESIPKHKVFRAKGGGLNNKSNKTASSLLPNHLNEKEDALTKQTSLSGKTPQVLASATKDKNSTTESVTSKEQPRYGRFSTSLSVSPLYFVETNKDDVTSSNLSATNHDKGVNLVKQQTIYKKSVLHKSAIDTASTIVLNSNVKRRSSFKRKQQAPTTLIKSKRSQSVSKDLALTSVVNRFKYDSKVSSQNLNNCPFNEALTISAPSKKLSQHQILAENTKAEDGIFLKDIKKRSYSESHSTVSNKSACFNESTNSNDVHSMLRLRANSEASAMSEKKCSTKVSCSPLSNAPSITVTSLDSVPVDIPEVDTIDYGHIRNQGIKARKPKQTRFCPMGSKNRLALPGMVTRSKFSSRSDECSSQRDKKSQLVRIKSIKRHKSLLHK